MWKVVFGVSFPTYRLKIVNYKNIIEKLVFVYGYQDSTYFPNPRTLVNSVSMGCGQRLYVTCISSCLHCVYFTNVCLLLIIKNSSNMGLQP